MSDISVSEIGELVVAKRNRFDAFGLPIIDDDDDGAKEESEPYAFSDIDVRILYLVHGKTMGFDIPHDTKSTDPSRSYDRYYFAPDYFNADGSWKVFPKWVSDRSSHEDGMFPVDGASGYISVAEISAIWHSVNGTEYGRPAWLDDADGTDGE